MKLLTAVVVAAAALTLAGVASAKTKDEAFRDARKCLIKRAGADWTGRRGDGGGIASLARGSTFWTYKTFLGQVSSTTVYFAGIPAPTRAMRAKVEACLRATQD